MKAPNFRRSVATWLAIILPALTAPLCLASPETQHKGFEFIVDRDATVAAGDTLGSIVVIGGTLTVEGTVDVVIVIEGEARLSGATVGEVIIVSGTGVIGQATVVERTVQLVNSTVTHEPGSVVRGGVRTDVAAAYGAGIATFGIIFGVGYSIALVIAAALFAAAMPRVARDASAMMTHEVGRTAVGTVIAWIAIPVAAALLAATLIGIPFAIGVFVFVLPALAFVGYLVAAVRMGGWLVSVLRMRPSYGRPFKEALVGVIALIVLGWIPIVGGLITFLAMLGGSGALVQIVWRSMRAPVDGTSRATSTDVATA